VAAAEKLVQSLRAELEAPDLTPEEFGAQLVAAKASKMKLLAAQLQQVEAAAAAVADAPTAAALAAATAAATATAAAPSASAGTAAAMAAVPQQPPPPLLLPPRPQPPRPQPPRPLPTFSMPLLQPLPAHVSMQSLSNLAALFPSLLPVGPRLALARPPQQPFVPQPQQVQPPRLLQSSQQQEAPVVASGEAALFHISTVNGVPEARV
jgi:hypothetical protein